MISVYITVGINNIHTSNNKVNSNDSNGDKNNTIMIMIIIIIIFKNI